MNCAKNDCPFYLQGRKDAMGFMGLRNRTDSETKCDYKAYCKGFAEVCAALDASSGNKRNVSQWPDYVQQIYKREYERNVEE
jgi:hypothetical protein